MKKTCIKSGLLLLAVLLLNGCSSMGGSTGDANGDGSSGAPVTDANGDNGDATTSGANQGGQWQGNPLDDPNSLLSTRTIYFDFDQSDIRPESVDVLRAHAAYLLNNSGASITVEGHCDERGSREYNIGLGERRASAIKRFLQAEGVADSQINTISYGEEKPVDSGHGEAAWSMNRRGELVY